MCCLHGLVVFVCGVAVSAKGPRLPSASGPRGCLSFMPFPAGARAQPSTSFYPKCRGSLHGGAQRAKLRGGVSHRSTSVTLSVLSAPPWLVRLGAGTERNEPQSRGGRRACGVATRRLTETTPPWSSARRGEGRRRPGLHARSRRLLKPGGHGGLAGLKTGDLTQSRRRIILRA